MTTTRINGLEEEKGIIDKMERRVNRRLDASLPIMLPTGVTETKNVSTGGAYVELDTSDAELYSVGQSIPVWLDATHSSNNYPAQQLWIYSDAVVVRKVKAISDPESGKWGFGLMFEGKVDTMLSTISGYY